MERSAIKQKYCVTHLSFREDQIKTIMRTYHIEIVKIESKFEFVSFNNPNMNRRH